MPCQQNTQREHIALPLVKFQVVSELVQQVARQPVTNGINPSEGAVVLMTYLVAASASVSNLRTYWTCPLFWDGLDYPHEAVVAGIEVKPVLGIRNAVGA